VRLRLMPGPRMLLGSRLITSSGYRLFDLEGSEPYGFSPQPTSGDFASKGRKTMSKVTNLVPLGIIHSDAYDHCREPLVRLIEAEWRAGRLTLWGYRKGENWNKCEPVPYPASLELELCWVSGPSREDGSNPRFPGLEYCCDVSALHRNNLTLIFGLSC
jgi:hypothetical protein